jgi:hypothetical protein
MTPEELEQEVSDARAFLAGLADLVVQYATEPDSEEVIAYLMDLSALVSEFVTDPGNTELYEKAQDAMAEFCALAGLAFAGGVLRPPQDGE